MTLLPAEKTERLDIFYEFADVGKLCQKHFLLLATLLNAYGHLSSLVFMCKCSCLAGTFISCPLGIFEEVCFGQYTFDISVGFCAL